MSLTPIDRFAGGMIIAFFAFALIFARNQDYTRSGSKSIERVNNSQTLSDVRFGMEERLATNALYDIGAITVLPKLTKDGKLDVRVKFGGEIPRWSDCITRYLKDDRSFTFYESATYSIVAIEMFNRPAAMRWLKDHLAWAVAWLGWKPSFSLGIGQIKVARVAGLEPSLNLPKDDQRAKYLAEVALLTEDCSNVALVAALVEEAYDAGHDKPVSARKRSTSELAHYVEDIARKYNGMGRNAVVFDYGVMVQRAFELLARAEARSAEPEPAAGAGSADQPQTGGTGAGHGQLSIGIPSLRVLGTRGEPLSQRP